MDQAHLVKDAKDATTAAAAARVGAEDDNSDARSPTYYDDSELDMIKADEALRAPVAGQVRKKKVSRRRRAVGEGSDDSGDEDYMPTTAKQLFVCLDVPPRPVRKCRRREE
jgi:hypothetical protein